MNLETADENKMDSIGSKIDPKNYFLPQSHLRHNLYNLLQVKQILFPEKRLFIPHYSQNRGRRETCSFLRGCILASTFSSSSKSFASKRCDSAAFLLFKGHHIIRQSSLRPRRDLKKRFQEKFQSSSFLLSSERVLPIPNLPYLKACRNLKS